MTLLYIVEKIKDGNIIGLHSSFFKMSAKKLNKKRSVKRTEKIRCI